MSAYKFNLDLHSSQSQVSLAVKQGDTDRSFEITLSDGSEAFILPAYSVAALLIKKPNGNTYTSGCIIEYSSVIKFDFNAAVATESGINICELKIYSGDKLIASPSFTMIVSDRAVKTEDISIPEGDVSEFDKIYASEAQRNFNEYGADGTGQNSGRVYNELQRMMREDDRVAAEEARKTAENERAAAENERAAAESGRDSNEETRMQNEDVRIGNESDRIEAEKSRNEAESNRNNNYETAEENRYLAYNNAEASRNEEYSLYEADRENSYNSTETTRNTRYNQAEERRDRAYKQAEAKRDYKSTASAYDALDERVTNIESFINPKYYITTEERAFERVIPANACPYIELNSVGSAYSRVSKNLFDPALFGLEVNSAGLIHYPGGNAFKSATIHLTAGAYTISSQLPLHITAPDADAVGPDYVSTFFVPNDGDMYINVVGDYSDVTEEEQWFSVMLNEGETALPFERFVCAPEKASDNLISFPYYNGSNTINGIAFTINADGSLTLNGINDGTKNSVLILHTSNTKLSLAPGTYTMGATGNDNVVFRLNDGIAPKDASINPFTFTITETTKFDVFVYVKTGTTLNNFTVRPMLNKGETALPYEPYYTGTKSTKVTAIEHYGANLVDDVAFFTEVGFIKQSNGYWLGKENTTKIFENTKGISGKISIKYTAKIVSYVTGTPLTFRIDYTDGTKVYEGALPTTALDYTTIDYTTSQNKTVSAISFWYSANGTYEIKDLQINYGGKIAYHPYSAEPIFTLNIPQSIQNLNGYGFGKIDFDNKKHIQEFDENGELSNPIITDISSYLIGFDNTLEVQAGGTLRFINVAKAAIPSTISYLAKEGSV